MAETHFKIIFEGKLRNGVELQTAKLNLASLFKSEASVVDKLFSDQPVDTQARVVAGASPALPERPARRGRRSPDRGRTPGHQPEP